MISVNWILEVREQKTKSTDILEDRKSMRVLWPNFKTMSLTLNKKTTDTRWLWQKLIKWNSLLVPSPENLQTKNIPDRHFNARWHTKHYWHTILMLRVMLCCNDLVKSNDWVIIEQKIVRLFTWNFEYLKLGC